MYNNIIGMSEPINTFYSTFDPLLDTHQGGDLNNNTSLDSLYNIISQKDEIIEVLKNTNEGLSEVINNFNSNIDKTNEKVSQVLSQISTAQDIDQIMKNEKNLKQKIDLLTEHTKKLTNNLLVNATTYNNLKNTYFGLNKLYISKFNNASQTHTDNSILENKINMLEDKLETTNNMFKCQICFNNIIDIIVIPCYHIYICKECVEQIIENTDDSAEINCPVCNERIIETKSISLKI